MNWGEGENDCDGGCLAELLKYHLEAWLEKEETLEGTRNGMRKLRKDQHALGKAISTSNVDLYRWRGELMHPLDEKEQLFNVLKSVV